jgi:hypothetical protein
MAHPDAIEALLALADAQSEAHRSAPRAACPGMGGADEERLVVHGADADYLHLGASQWAGADPAILATAPFAKQAALFAMKLHAIQDRRPASRPEKRGSDALDLYRLLLELDADDSLRAALANTPAPLRRVVRAAAQKVMIDGAVRTRGFMAAVSYQTGRVTADELRYLTQPVMDALG